MSDPHRHLPAELLDQIVDFLRDARGALKSCCLVSKSWIPRARRHLFALITFHTAKNLQSWKTMFPDPSTSPACYTRSLLVRSPQAITTLEAEDGGWISNFLRIAHLEIVVSGRVIDEPEVLLLPFHKFSPTIKSLRINFEDLPLSCISDLVHSFPRLQDLAISTNDWLSCSSGFYKPAVAIQPSNPFTFTGSLKLSLEMGMGTIASRLLSLPNGLHFRELRLTWHREEDVPFMAALVEKCSPTLETLKITSDLVGATVQRSTHAPSDDLPLFAGNSQGSIDLSKVIKLREAVFVCQRYPQWVAVTLQTLVSNHKDHKLRQISICASSVLYALDPGYTDPTYLRNVIGESTYQEWLGFDRILTHLLESQSTRLKVVYVTPFWVYG